MQRFVGLRCRGPCALTGGDARSLGQPAATGTVALSLWEDRSPAT